MTAIPRIPGDRFAKITGWLIAASISFIGLDEFNIGLGLFSLKAAMMPLIAAVALIFIRWLSGQGTVPPRNIPAVLFIIYAIFTCALFYLGATDTSALVNRPEAMAANPVAKLFNLIMLSVFAYMGSRYLTAKQLYVSAIGLILIQTGVFFYCVWVLLHGGLDRIFWLPGGIPRFALDQGGMSPNQMGAIWLVASIIFVFMIAYRPGSKWRWCLVLIAALGAISTMSRSMMIGLALLMVGYAIVRPRLTTTIVMIALIVSGGIAFAIYQSSRIEDASALDRFSKWAFTLEDFQTNFLLGSGIGTNPAPHSVWLQILSETGVVGFFLAALALFQMLIGDGIPRKILELCLLLFLPYAFFLSVDIPLLQWQTWVIPIAISIGHREFAQNAVAPTARLALI